METRWKKFKPLLRFHRIPVIVIILSFIVWKYITREDFSRYPNGQIKQSGQQVNGLNEGLWTWYYPSGKKNMTGSFKKGKRNGPWVIYHPNGNLASERNYENDHLNGRFIDYTNKGRKKREGSFLLDQLHGTILNFSDTGEVDMKEQYAEGILLSKEIMHHE